MIAVAAAVIVLVVNKMNEQSAHVLDGGQMRSTLALIFHLPLVPPHFCVQIVNHAVGARKLRWGVYWVYSRHVWPESYNHRSSHLHNAGTEYVGFSPTRQTVLTPSAKRRQVFGGSHEG